jgi:hypothetical protein
MVISSFVLFGLIFIVFSVAMWKIVGCRYDDVQKAADERRDGERFRNCASLLSQYNVFQRKIEERGVESTLTICDFFRGTDCDDLLGKVCEKAKNQK